MDIPNIYIVGVQTQAHHAPDRERRYHADIVLIDKTNQNLAPLLYKFKVDDLKKSSLSLLGSDSCMMIGEVLLDEAHKPVINKHDKVIVLKNGDVVSYTHLIAITGTKSHIDEQEFLTAFHALLEALKVRNNLPSQFSENGQNFQILNAKQAKPPSYSKGESSACKASGKVPNPHFLQRDGKTLTVDLSSLLNPRFELQL